MIQQFYATDQGLQVIAEADSPALNYIEGLLWIHDTYKDVYKSIDISSYLTQSTIENFLMDYNQLGLASNEGIFYIQLFDNTTINYDPLITPINNDFELGVCTNLSSFYEYFLSVLVKEIDKIDCNCSSKCLESTHIITIIEAIKTALILRKFNEANLLYIDMLQQVKLCTNCTGNYIVDGYNVRTLDNEIVVL